MVHTFWEIPLSSFPDIHLEVLCTREVWNASYHCSKSAAMCPVFVGCSCHLFLCQIISAALCKNWNNLDNNEELSQHANTLMSSITEMAQQEIKVVPHTDLDQRILRMLRILRIEFITCDKILEFRNNPELHMEFGIPMEDQFINWNCPELGGTGLQWRIQGWGIHTWVSLGTPSSTKLRVIPGNSRIPAHDCIRMHLIQPSLQMYLTTHKVDYNTILQCVDVQQCCNGVAAAVVLACPCTALSFLCVRDHISSNTITGDIFILVITKIHLYSVCYVLTTLSTQRAWLIVNNEQ